MKWVPSYSVARASGVSVTALPNAIHHRNVERTRTRCELMLGQGGCSQVTRAMIGADHEVGPKDCAPSKGGCRRSFWAQSRIEEQASRSRMFDRFRRRRERDALALFDLPIGLVRNVLGRPALEHGSNPSGLFGADAVLRKLCGFGGHD